MDSNALCFTDRAFCLGIWEAFCTPPNPTCQKNTTATASSLWSSAGSQLLFKKSESMIKQPALIKSHLFSNKEKKTRKACFSLSFLCNDLNSCIFFETLQLHRERRVTISLLLGEGVVFNLDSIRKSYLASLDEHNQSCLACSPLPTVFIGSIWFCNVVWEAHINTHGLARSDTQGMLTHHK